MLDDDTSRMDAWSGTDVNGKSVDEAYGMGSEGRARLRARKRAEAVAKAHEGAKRRVAAAKKATAKAIRMFPRVRWDRVAASVVAGGLVVAVPVAMSRNAPQEPDSLGEFMSFVGPYPLVGYSQTTAAYKAAKRLEAEMEKLADETPEAEDGSDSYLLRDDGNLQREEDLDLSGANRDNVIPRAVRGWRAPSWIDGVDWDSLYVDEGGNPIERPVTEFDRDDGTSDAQVEGYEDIVRITFADDAAFSWALQDGTRLDYDGHGRVTGDAAVALDQEEALLYDSHALYARDAVSSDRYDVIRMAAEGDRWTDIMVTDRVVPDSEEGRLMTALIMGYGVDDITIGRRSGSVEAQRSGLDSLPEARRTLILRSSLMRPKGRIYDEGVSVSVRSRSASNLKVTIDGFGVRIETTDEAGLTDVEATLTFTKRTDKCEKVVTVDGGEKSIDIEFDDSVEGAGEIIH